MNKDVGTNGMGVTVGTSIYELRFYGENKGAKGYTPVKENNIVVSYTDQDLYGKIIPNTDYAYNLPDGVEITQDYYDTDGGHPKVILRMDTAYKEPSKEKGLNPGDGGEILFWVIPKINGTITAHFSFNIRGYTADQSKSAPYDVTSISPIPTEVPSSGLTNAEAELVAKRIQAVRYLNTHILFFKETNTGTEENPNWVPGEFLNDDIIENGYFTMEFTDAVVDEPIEVRIRWDWTNTFQQMVLSTASDPVTVTPAVRSAIQEYVYDHWDTVFKDMTFEDIQAKMMISDGEGGYSFSEETVNTGTNLDDLSRGYNRADSDIGNCIDYMLLVLTAE